MMAGLLNHRVGAPKNRQRKGEANGIRGLHVDDQFDLGGLLNRRVRRLIALRIQPVYTQVMGERQQP